MLRVIFTTDYEIHGNGDGSPRELMVESTARNLELFRAFGARLTIMADVAEIERFGQFAVETGSDQFASEAIREQLRDAVQNGHDVQLHIHPSYYEAEWREGRWQQDYGTYDLTQLGADRLRTLIAKGKRFLEDLLVPVRADYRCEVFRAANWSMQPSGDIVRALVANGMRVDTSVFKYGRRAGLVGFDYSGAWSDVVPWPVSAADVCMRDLGGQLFEVPIYSEPRWIGAFISVGRAYRFLQSRRHRLGAGFRPNSAGGGSGSGIRGALNRLFSRHAWKMDFNQCSSDQLIGGLLRAERKVSGAMCDLPLVLIGHSKLFTRSNARHLEPFLQFISQHPERFAFGVFGDVDLAAIRRQYHAATAGAVAC